MNVRNFFTIYFLSFYSQELYLTIANKWKNWGLNFLLRFSFLSSLIISTVLFIIVATKDFNELDYLFDQIPPISIYDNEAHLVNQNQEKIQEIKDLNNRTIAMVDLNINDPAGKYPDVPLIFSKDRISFAFLFNSNFSLYYSELKKIYNINVLDSKTLTEFLIISQKKFLISTPFIIMPVLSIILLILQFIKALLYSAPAIVISELFHHNLKFKQIVRVASVINAPTESIFLVCTFLLFFISNQFLANIIQLIGGNLYLLYFIVVYVTIIKRSKYF